MGKSFKSFACRILVTVLAASLAACGNSSIPKASDSAATSLPANAAAVKEIKLLMFSDWYKSGMQAIEKDINDHADQLGFKLNIEKIAGGDQGNSLMRARFAANELPMLLADYGTKWEKENLGGLAHFQEIGGDWEKNYPDSILKSANFSDNGSVYGIPFDAINIMGVFYNKKVFEKLAIQVPQTYQQFLDALAKIKAAGITPIYLPAKDTWTVSAFEHEGWLRLNQPLAPIFDRINTNHLHFAADFPLVQDTLAKHKALLDNGYIQKTYLADTYDGAQKAVAEGTAAMTINATWIIDPIKAKFPDKVNDIGAFRVPFDEDKGTSLLLPFNMAVTEQFTDKELLKKFIDYFTSQKTQQIFYDAQGGIPVIKGVHSKLAPAQADLKKIVDDGYAVPLWADLTKYNTGNLEASILDYFLGVKTLDNHMKDMDDNYAKDAKAKGDPNWK